MSGFSRLLWAAACLAALCVPSAGQDTTLAPNVTSAAPNRTVTTPLTLAPLTTHVPGAWIWSVPSASDSRSPSRAAALLSCRWCARGRGDPRSLQHGGPSESESESESSRGRAAGRAGRGSGPVGRKGRSGPNSFRPESPSSRRFLYKRLQPRGGSGAGGRGFLARWRLLGWIPGRWDPVRRRGSPRSSLRREAAPEVGKGGKGKRETCTFAGASSACGQRLN